ncbi:MAG: DUF4153 domain-containing protein [Candidatus Gracilibacteria bacterium]
MKKLTLFVKSLLARTKETIRRYPVSLAVIVLAFSLMMLNTWLWESWGGRNMMLDRVTAIAWVVLPIFTAITLFLKRRGWLLLGLILGLALFFTTEDGLPQGDIQQLMLWGFAFYSLMFLLPHWKKNQNNGFWSYCARIFFILILGLVCSGILALSLTLAVESIRNLFELDIDYRWNETMMLFSFSFVLPVFVHIGLPQDWKSFEKNTNYPDFFRPVSYYLLTPISLLFFGILSVYMLKILFTWEWPSGQVAYPVLFLSLVTFGFYLISYPWRQNWQRWFFVALLPFLAMYFLALNMRIEQYGLTELRYLGILLGLCLVFMSGYFAFVKRQRLQMMLVPLAVFAFIFAVGPWGASEVPVCSQEKKLETMLTQIGALQDGKLLEVDSTAVSEEMVTSISSIVEYLYWRDRLTDLQAWTDVDLNEDIGETLMGYIPENFMAEIGLEYRPYAWDQQQDDLWFDYGAPYMSTYEVTGFDSMVEFDVTYDSHFAIDPTIFTLEDGLVTLSMTANSDGTITISNGESSVSFDVLALEKQLNASEKNAYEMSPEDLVLDSENQDMRLRIYVGNMNGEYEDEEMTTLVNFTVWGKLLVSLQ